MIDSATLLSDLQGEVSKLEDDLRVRCDAEPAVNAPLQAQYEQARARKRTALTYKAWREEELTNVAVAWILACVFVRFLEDNSLVDTLHLAGPDAVGLARARDQHELYFRQHPHVTEREYLEHVFNQTAVLPGMKEFFDRRHNPLWSVGPTGDAAASLMNFWRKDNPETGRPVHDFSDPEWNTRFLGDLYQDLSEAARKRYALLQTPDFVEDFILDRTLTPAIETFGFRVVRMIDPTCGSGHFLLGGFARLHRLWVDAEPAEAPAVLAQRALNQVFGVDLNPNVIAIARFRLLLAALRATGTKRLRDAFDFTIHLASGDALLHGRRFRAHEMDFGVQRTFDTEELFKDELKHHYDVEDVETLHHILGQQYHAVVGNPPYITVKDRAISELYRARYPSCHRRYSLSVPFMERFFDLAIKGDATPQRQAGFVGQITANSFMKREFGKKLIEAFLPQWDLGHVIDTSGAYIPGHGTPTVILLGRNQPPVGNSIRTVLGISGEPKPPEDPSRGVVWQAICDQIDTPGVTSEWVSATDSPRENFHHHPWSIGGGGAAELKELLDEAAANKLVDWVEINRKRPDIGFASFSGFDEAFSADIATLRRARIPNRFLRGYITGDVVRDWVADPNEIAFAPYDEQFRLIPLAPHEHWAKWLWSNKTGLRNIASFEETREAEGQPWWSWYRWIPERYSRSLSITFAHVATHNHFVFDRGGRVFNQHAPVIKLRSEFHDPDYLRILGVLNSSTACFWMKQVFSPKGGDHVGGEGARVRKTLWDERYEFDGGKLASCPIPPNAPIVLSNALFKESFQFLEKSPRQVLVRWDVATNPDLRAWISTCREDWARLRRQMIVWQEELDWQTYEAFGLAVPNGLSLPEDSVLEALPPEGIAFGERAFEIFLARKGAANSESKTTWFERHQAKPTVEVPRHWPSAYRELVERRIARIENDPSIRLLEQPENKRRWNTKPWDEQFQQAARDWLLVRLEGYFFEGQRVCGLKDGFNPTSAGFAAATLPALTTTNQLAGTAQTDAAFLAVSEALIGGPGFSVPKLVRDLVESASVPFLPAQRYKPSGLLKRRDWEHVWDLQRQEDAIDAAEKIDEPGIADIERAERKASAAVRRKAELGDIPVPPKYTANDFRKSVWWSLRGKLDVPKERWVVYPGAERGEDPSPVIAWAGWDHAQQARALAEYYLEGKQNFGFSPEKLKLLLAGLLDLEPWLFQSHSTLDPLVGDSPANAIRAFLDAECHALGVTRADLEVVRMGS